MEQYAIQSVDRAFQLLETISLHPQGLSLTELVNQTQLNKSTAYRLLSSLIAHGYVIKDSRSNTYHISLKLYEIGCRTVNANGFLPVVEPVLRGLAVETNEAIHFVLREENSVVYLYKEEPVQSVIHRRPKPYVLHRRWKGDSCISAPGGAAADCQDDPIPGLYRLHAVHTGGAAGGLGADAPQRLCS